MTFEEALIEHCSPTLAGVKPASLFRFCPRDSALFVRRFLALRQQFAARGLRLVILRAAAARAPTCSTCTGSGIWRRCWAAENTGIFCALWATPRGRRPATACGSWPPASVWRRNSPRDRRLSGLSSG